MATIKINVKWGKENVPCEIKPGQTPDQLFDDLQNKTGVPVARQKLMARGAWRGVLKSGMAMDLKDGQNVTLMGTADVLLKPKVETKFLEDMKVTLSVPYAVVVPRRRLPMTWVFFFLNFEPFRTVFRTVSRFRAGGGPSQEWFSTTGGLRQFGEHVLHELDAAVLAGRA